ncbi:hypothetical protein GSI_02894 [Ganoderma sinense ZZ0214-1]|uniref:Uncharacterized protein n=1 Tax=Ganoderma sinense ZZ0214-1 TaxID=1077348 RepID=A0A2G8SMW1_9APHY|nr:hypothetical protein GSI_02894 [Ganoderma sinense ZZ0214-1]
MRLSMRAWNAHFNPLYPIVPLIHGLSQKLAGREVAKNKNLLFFSYLNLVRGDGARRDGSSSRILSVYRELEGLVLPAISYLALPGDGLRRVQTGCRGEDLQ